MVVGRDSFQENATSIKFCCSNKYKKSQKTTAPTSCGEPFLPAINRVRREVNYNDTHSNKSILEQLVDYIL